MLEPLHHVETRSQSPKSNSSDKRHSSSASASTSSSSATKDERDVRGRRSRPSATASSSQLESVQEMMEHKAHRALSSDSTLSLDFSNERPSIANVASNENVISSKKVCYQVVSANLPRLPTLGLDFIQQSSFPQHRKR